jgi:uncharacterized protein (TIGR00255 family)
VAKRVTKKATGATPASTARPIASMTGYGRASSAPAGSGKAAGGAIRIEITSVNNRYLKLTLKASDAVQSLRQKIDGALRTHVVRGSVTVAVHYAPPACEGEQLVDRDRLERYVRALDRATKPLGLARPADWSSLTSLPGVFQNEESTPVDKGETARIIAAVDEAAAALAEDRRREGTLLVRDIRRRLKTVAQSVRAIRRAAPQVVTAFADRLDERMRELMKRAGVEAEPQDVLREIAAFAERVDITEELTRLDAHVGHFEDILQAGGECGKRIDFLLQEIQREVNTIGSKAGNTDISPHVVRVKGEVEKIREQVQNIE